MEVHVYAVPGRSSISNKDVQTETRIVLWQILTQEDLIRGSLGTGQYFILKAYNTIHLSFLCQESQGQWSTKGRLCSSRRNCQQCSINIMSGYLNFSSQFPQLQIWCWIYSVALDLQCGIYFDQEVFAEGVSSFDVYLPLVWCREDFGLICFLFVCRQTPFASQNWIWALLQAQTQNFQSTQHQSAHWKTSSMPCGLKMNLGVNLLEKNLPVLMKGDHQYMSQNATVIPLLWSELAWEESRLYMRWCEMMKHAQKAFTQKNGPCVHCQQNWEGNEAL